MSVSNPLCGKVTEIDPAPTPVERDPVEDTTGRAFVAMGEAHGLMLQLAKAADAGMLQPEAINDMAEAAEILGRMAYQLRAKLQTRAAKAGGGQ
jgi:hypothetical protein